MIYLRWFVIVWLVIADGQRLHGQSKLIIEDPLGRDLVTETVNFNLQKLVRADEKYIEVVKDLNALTEKWNALIRQETTTMDVKNPNAVSIEKARLKGEWRKLAGRMEEAGDAKRNAMRDLAKALRNLPPKDY